MYPTWTIYSLKKFSQLEFQIVPNHIDIWKFNLNTFFPDAKNLLNDKEKKRAYDFYQPIHQQRFIHARAFVKLVLSKYLKNISPKNLDFIENAHGKPSLFDAFGLEFNLSHSGDFVLLGIADKTPIGIDLEIQKSSPHEDIAELLFSPPEIQALKNSPHYLKNLSFFNIWSQKEAFIKACGMGLSYPTKTFTVPALPQSVSLIEEPWHTTRFTPQLGYSGAICHPHQQFFLKFYHLGS